MTTELAVLPTGIANAMVSSRIPTTASTPPAVMSGRVPVTTFGPQGTAGELDLWGISTNPNHITVTDSSALGLSAFWAAVTLISEAMCTMPIKVWKRTKAGGRDWADQHPSNYCLTKTTNGWQTPSVFKSFAQSCLLMNGNFVGEVIRNGRGQCSSIRHWLPRNTMYGVNSDGDPMYGVMGNAYQSPTLPIVEWKNYQLPTAEWFEYPEVVHLKGFGSDGYLGRSVLASARSSLGLSMTVEKFGDRFFTHGRPVGFLAKDGSLTKQQRDQIRQEWKEMYEGVQNALNVGVLSNGLDWVSMGFNSNDAQFLQSRQFQVLEIARWFRISPHMLGDLSQVTEANIEQLMLHFIQFTLLPWMTRWEEELNLKLFTPMEQFSYYVQFDIDAFLRGDKLTQAKVDTENLRNGQRTIEETRLRDGFNPYEDGSGKIPLVMASQLSTLKSVEDGTSPLQSGSAGGAPTSTADEPAPKKKPAKKKAAAAS